MHSTARPKVSPWANGGTIQCGMDQHAKGTNKEWLGWVDPAPENAHRRSLDGGVGVVNHVQCHGSADSDTLGVHGQGTDRSRGFCFRENRNWRDVQNGERVGATVSEPCWWFVSEDSHDEPGLPRSIPPVHLATPSLDSYWGGHNPRGPIGSGNRTVMGPLEHEAAFSVDGQGMHIWV